MDIIERIKKEHQDIDGMLQELSRGYDRQLFKKMKLSLTAHMSAEEASLYPAMDGHEHEMVENAGRGHQEIRNALSKFKMVETDEFPSKLSKLAEAVRDHIKDEEDILRKSQEMLDQEKVNEISYLFAEIERRIMERAL